MPLLLLALPDLSLFLSLKSLLFEEPLLLLLPLSLPLRLLPGRTTINPVTTPPPCSGALNEIILSLPSISPDGLFFFLFSGTRGVAAGVCCVGVSEFLFFRRDVGSEVGGGCGCGFFFEGLRLGFSDFVENAGERETPVRGLPGASLVASRALFVDGFLLGAEPAATLLLLDDFLAVESFLDSGGGAEDLNPDGCRVATRPDGKSLSVDALFEPRRLCLLGDSGAGPSDDEPEEDDDDEGSDFPLATGGGPREMGGRHMVVGEHGRGASRQDLWRNAGSSGLLGETIDDG